LVRPVKNWVPVDTAMIGFGQGVSVTAIQLIAAVSAIANNGVLMKPYVVRGFTDKDNRLIKLYTPTVVRKVISPDVSKRLTKMLTEVVGAVDGTGKNARIVNVAVAGKTGLHKNSILPAVYIHRKKCAHLLWDFSRPIIRRLPFW